jgi:hypothetical protein
MDTAVKNTRVEFKLAEGITKSQVATMATNAVDAVLEKGNILQVAEVLSGMEAFIKAVKADPRFPDYVREELAKSSGKYTTASGAKIEACETGVSYDFSQDIEWSALNEGLEKIKADLKAREERLKKIEPGKLLVDQDTGESLVGPVRSSKSSYKITLAK